MTMTSRATQYVAGLHISPTRISATIFDHSLRPAGRTKRSTKPERGPSAVAERMARTVLDAVDEADLELSLVTRVGVAMSAEFHPVFASPQRPLIAPWKDLATILQELLKAPVLSVPVGFACAAGVRAAGHLAKSQRTAVIFVEEELAGGMIIGTELAEGFDQSVVGEERWFDWGKELRGLPGKKRYRKLSGLLAKADLNAIALFEKLTKQLSRVLTRCVEQFNPDTIALVGSGAEELKPELISALSAAEGFRPQLANVNITVPAFGFNICHAGAASLALG